MKISSIAGALLAMIGFAGCATGGGLLKPVVSQQPVVTTKLETVTNTVIQTNYVTNLSYQIQTLTNGVTITNIATITHDVFNTNTVIETIPVTVTNTVNVTNAFVVSSAASNVMTGLNVANTLTGPFDPFSGSVSVFLALASAGLVGMPKSKPNRLRPAPVWRAPSSRPSKGLSRPQPPPSKRPSPPKARKWAQARQ
jgi:hypothetical protein